MNITISIYDEDGDEIEIELPAKYIVCPKCEGHGTHLIPSIGEHAYSEEEFAEAFDDEGRSEYFKRGGIYDVKCTVCKGERVALTVDEDACKSEDEIRDLKKYHEFLKWKEAEEKEREAERRMGA